MPFNTNRKGSFNAFINGFRLLTDDSGSTFADGGLVPTGLNHFKF